MLPGQTKPVENNNKDFNQELNDKYIKVDWYLGRSQSPYLKNANENDSEDISSLDEQSEMSI